MVRDKLKDGKYFEDYIICQNKRIDKFKSVAEQLPDSEEDKRSKCQRMIANFQKDLFAAEYSIGTSKAELERVFNEYLNVLNEIKTEEYAEYADAIAIGILLDIDIKELKSIKGNENLNDGFILALTNYPDISKKTLNYADYYQPFFDFLSGKSSRDSFIKYMASSWYESNKEFAWYDSDKSTEDIYTGYWCWIAAACLKLRKEETDGVVSFIPYDLI